MSTKGPAPLEIERKHGRSRFLMGFTLVEVLLYIGFLAIMTGFFAGVLFTVIRVQYKETASAEVSQQAEFLLNTIKRNVIDSALIEMDSGSATSTLTLRMANSAVDPTTIYLDGTTAYIKETATGTPVAITTNEILVDSLSFTKYSNAPAPDSIQINFTISYNTTNIQRQTTKSYTTAISRVSAATFDSNLIPGADSSYSFGTASNRWSTGRFSGDVIIEGNTVVATATNPYTEALYVWGDIHASSYLQFSKNSATSPAATDCDSDTERGRMSIGTTDNRVYLCNGAVRGWDYISLTD